MEMRQGLIVLILGTDDLEHEFHFILTMKVAIMVDFLAKNYLIRYNTGLLIKAVDKGWKTEHKITEHLKTWADFCP